MGSLLTDSVLDGCSDCKRDRIFQLRKIPCAMKEWEIFVPYLPRVKSTKRRWDDVPPAYKSRPPLQTLALSDVNNRSMEWRRSNCFQPEMIPEPDYTDPEDEDNESEERSGDDDEEVEKTSDSAKSTDSSGDESHSSRTTSSGSVTGSSGSSHASTSHLSDEGFVLPKKPSNPYLQSSERQKLHKELKFNQKYGKSVVGKKSELQLAMDKYKENKLRKDTVQQQTSLEKLLDQRAKRIQMQENQPTESQPEWMGRLKEQRETWVDPKDDEFYRVHAKVVTHGGYSRNADDKDKEERHPSHSRDDHSSSP